jgi:DNA polymerase-1
MLFVKPLVTEPDDVAELAWWVRSLPADAVVAWDTETSGLRPFNGDHLTGISIQATGTSATYVPVGHPRGNVVDVSPLIDALQHTKATHLVHHAQFDWTQLALTYGFDPCRVTSIDTQVCQWLRDENQRKGLKYLGEMYLGEDAAAEQRALKALMKPPPAQACYKHVRTEFPELKAKEARRLSQALQRALTRGWGDLEPDEIAPYAAMDAEITYRLGVDEFQVDPVMPAPALDREMDVVRCLWRMRMRGITVNPDGLSRALTAYTARADEIAAKYEGTSLGSAKQVATLLYEQLGLPVYEKTPGGEPSTSKNALEQHEGHPVVADLLEWRRMSKAASAYAAPLFEWASTSIDGRIHPEFNNTGTVTGRFSCSDPNLMQIPRGDTLPEIRDCFQAADGMELWEFDLGQAELRVAASISGDDYLTAALVEGRDLHTETAQEMFGRSDGRWRVLAKNVNFGILYGAGPAKVAVFLAKVGMSPQEARVKADGVLAAHRKMFPKLHACSRFFAERADAVGKLPLPAEGRYRHFRTPGMTVSGHKALNAMVQGGVAELMKSVMLEVDQALPGTLLLQVHDALVFEVEPGMGPKIEALLGEITGDVNPFKLPLSWDAKRW